MVAGTVIDPSGAVVRNAKVEIHNPVSQFDRTARTDNTGTFTIPNVPLNNYHLTVMHRDLPHSRRILTFGRSSR